MKRDVWLILFKFIQNNLVVRALFTGILILFSLTSYSQVQENLEADSALFDFWVGEWNLTWKDAEGNTQTGTNRVEKILDGMVLQEHFSDVAGNFKGTSISVYNPRYNSWHQAWADNQGGYYNFVGAVDDGRPVFKTKPIEVNDQTIIQRMVFFEIEENSFTWDWEKSIDGGESWTLLWRIDYKRIN